ncbi:MAG TPA: methyltransferase domain-containing protein [Candidatus Acidoferrum sp.]|nr:methyltransferase domain-containing protein [Candidatus Acidoferrum sp.]
MSQQTPRWDAELYDDKHSFVYKMAEELLVQLGPQPGEHILDIGCGTGHLSAKIAASGALVTGIDRSPEMIRQARAAYPQIRFELADARSIPLKTPFDAVFSNATLHWIKEPERVVHEIARLLKPGGRFVAELGGHGNIAKLVEAAKRAWLNLKFTQPMPNPWYYPSLPEYTGLLEKHGLQVSYAILFDRPTRLEEGENGLGNWLRMFGGAILGELSEDERDRFIQEAVHEARLELFKNAQWVVDYRRLRVIASAA